jgi:hypothetical protein
MKLLERAFDRAVEATRPVLALADALKSLAVEVEKLALSLSVIAHNQAIHHYMISQMQQILTTAMHDKSLDMKMPEIKPQDATNKDSDKKSGKDKPN